MATMKAWINPLACIPLELPQPTDPPTPEAARLLDYLFAPESEATAEAFARRYREVASVAAAFPIAPAEPTILGKLVWPLRHALYLRVRTSRSRSPTSDSGPAISTLDRGASETPIRTRLSTMQR